jgi:hypothetical protein
MIAVPRAICAASCWPQYRQLAPLAPSQLKSSNAFPQQGAFVGAFVIFASLRHKLCTHFAFEQLCPESDSPGVYSALPSNIFIVFSVCLSLSWP